MKRSVTQFVSLSAAFLCLIAIAAPAQTFHSLVNLTEDDGVNPVAGMAQGPNGAFYSTAISGGANDWGSIFRINSNGGIDAIYSFCPQPGCTDGALPSTGLTFATSGNFFGTTAAGGANEDGTIFRLTPSGDYTTTYSFCAQPNCNDGAEPRGALIEGTDGNLYGTTFGGGTQSFGTIFRVTRPGVLTSLHSFCLQSLCQDGSAPTSGLVEATDRNFYGTASAGGTCGIGFGCGTVFKITAHGTFSTVYNFCSLPNCADGSEPVAGLILASDGNLYGTTYSGGANNAGTIFQFTLQGKLTTLYSFCDSFNCADGSGPNAALIQGTDGSLYGATQFGGDINCNPSYDGMGCGTLFKINRRGDLSTLHVFEFTDGAYPQAPLMQATTGKFYGTTYGGGGNACGASGCGTVFSLDINLGPFVRLGRQAGKVGQTGPILGQGFTGTTNVSLNGTPATFTVVSDTEIVATVPAGAASGFVTVDTPSGKLSSNEPFFVLP